MKGFLIGAVLLLSSLLRVGATTWDEPWQKEIIEDADAFVRVRLTKVTPERVEFTVLKQLAGEKVRDKASLTGFSKLDFGSYSVKEDVFDLNPELEYYLFLKRTDKEGEYQIATPTSGFAATYKQVANATYRHSYHQALVPEDDYEMTMVAIFKELKHQTQDLAPVRKYIATQLALEPADMPEDMESEEFKRFCRQHVALESLYYLGGGDLAQMEPFLRHKNPHGQISAVRALGRLPKESGADRLLAFIAASDRDGFAKVMAIWALRDMKAAEVAPKLRAMLKSTKDDETGFGGNIMDPRVATRFPPSVHAAITQVLEGWEKKQPKAK